MSIEHEESLRRYLGKLQRQGGDQAAIDFLQGVRRRVIIQRMNGQASINGVPIGQCDAEIAEPPGPAEPVPEVPLNFTVMLEPVEVYINYQALAELLEPERQ